MDEFGRYPSGNKVTEEPEVLFARLKLDDVMKKSKLSRKSRRRQLLQRQSRRRKRTRKQRASISSRKQRLTYDAFCKTAVPDR